MPGCSGGMQVSAWISHLVTEARPTSVRSGTSNLPSRARSCHFLASRIAAPIQLNTCQTLRWLPFLFFFGLD